MAPDVHLRRRRHSPRCAAVGRDDRPSDDSERTYAARAGTWVEVRDAGGHGLYRQILADPVRADGYEAHSPIPPGVAPGRAGSAAGVFQVVVPDLPDAHDVALTARRHGVRRRRGAAQEGAGTALAQPVVTPPWRRRLRSRRADGHLRRRRDRHHEDRGPRARLLPLEPRHHVRGFTTAELDAFHVAAESFVTKLFTTQPFRRMWCAINVHRVDVRSDESGADEPATRADGGTGSGATRKTYFDSSFCWDGTSRLLYGSEAIAVATAQTAVPAVSARVVIVTPRGTGVPEGPARGSRSRRPPTRSGCTSCATRRSTWPTSTGTSTAPGPPVSPASPTSRRSPHAPPRSGRRRSPRRPRCPPRRTRAAAP